MMFARRFSGDALKATSGLGCSQMAVRRDREEEWAARGLNPASEAARPPGVVSAQVDC
jgi:hypothetical protein